MIEFSLQYLHYLNLILGLLSILTGLIILKKVRKKLNIPIIYLLASVIMFTTGEILRIFNLPEYELYNTILQTGVVLFIFLAALSMVNIIKELQKKYQKKRK